MEKTMKDKKFRNVDMTCATLFFINLYES